MSETPTWLQRAHKSAGWLVVLGVLQMVAGGLAVVSPFVTGLVATAFLGASLMIGGIAGLFAAFHADSFGSGALAFIWALIVAVAGFHFFTNPAMGLVTLTMVVAVMFFASGLIQSVMAFHMKPIRGWGWMLTSGILGVLMAFMVWREFPFSGVWFVGTLVGVHLLFAGVSTMGVGGFARRLTESPRNA